MPPTNCHQPIAIHQLLPTNCHQLIVTTGSDVRRGVAWSPQLCRCDLRGGRGTWCSPRGRMYALVRALMSSTHTYVIQHLRTPPPFRCTHTHHIYIRRHSETRDVQGDSHPIRMNNILPIFGSSLRGKQAEATETCGHQPYRSSCLLTPLVLSLLLELPATLSFVLTGSLLSVLRSLSERVCMPRSRRAKELALQALAPTFPWLPRHLQQEG